MRAVRIILGLVIIISMASATAAAQYLFECADPCGNGVCSDCEADRISEVKCNVDTGQCEDILIIESNYCFDDCCGDGICDDTELLKYHPKYPNELWQNYCKLDCNSSAVYYSFPSIPTAEYNVVVTNNSERIATPLAAFTNMTDLGLYEGKDQNFSFYDEFVNYTEQINGHKIQYPLLNASTGKPVSGTLTTIINPRGEAFKYEFELSKLIIREIEGGYLLQGDRLTRQGFAIIRIFSDRLEKEYLQEGDNVTIVWLPNMTESIISTEDLFHNLTFINGTYTETIKLKESETQGSSESQEGVGSSGYDRLPGDNTNKNWLAENLDRLQKSSNESAAVTKLIEKLPPIKDLNDKWKELVSGWFNNSVLGGSGSWVEQVCGSVRQLSSQNYASPITWNQEHKMAATIDAVHQESSYNISWMVDNGLDHELHFFIYLDEVSIVEKKLPVGKKSSDSIGYESSDEYNVVSIRFKNHLLSDGSNQLANRVVLK